MQEQPQQLLRITIRVNTWRIISKSFAYLDIADIWKESAALGVIQDDHDT